MGTLRSIFYTNLHLVNSFLCRARIDSHLAQRLFVHHVRALRPTRYGQGHQSNHRGCSPKYNLFH